MAVGVRGERGLRPEPLVIACDITMADLLIRDLSDADLRQLDGRAHALGLSRSEYVRRRLRQDVGAPRLTLADLERFAAVHRDLTDPQVMSGAWR